MRAQTHDYTLAIPYFIHLPTEDYKYNTLNARTPTHLSVLLHCCHEVGVLVLAHGRIEEALGVDGALVEIIVQLACFGFVCVRARFG